MIRSHKHKLSLLLPLPEQKGSLEADVSSLTSQASSYREQVCALQSQVTSLADQNTVMSKHNAALQVGGAGWTRCSLDS